MVLLAGYLKRLLWGKDSDKKEGDRMCGRYFFKLDENFLKLLRVRKQIEQLHFDFAQGEVFPSQSILTLLPDQKDDVQVAVKKWGVTTKSRLLINARSEGITDKYTFRPMLKNRCVIVVNGFYEWLKQANGKEKIYIQKEQEPVMFLAGIYNEQDECVIVTGEAQGAMKNIHSRTPIILNEQQMLAYLHYNQAFIVDNEQLLFTKE